MKAKFQYHNLLIFFSEDNEIVKKKTVLLFFFADFEFVAGYKTHILKSEKHRRDMEEHATVIIYVWTLMLIAALFLQ